MAESFSAALADISVLQLALIAGMALLASVVGGVSGYGSSALMPLVLVPILGPEPVVPILSFSALLNNLSRVAAYRQVVDLRRAFIVLPMAIPATMLGAWGYAQLSGRGASIVIGAMMVASVPLRRYLRRRGFALSNRGLAVASAGWGFVAGGTTGAGVMLLSMLMAVGLEGAAVIATDAIVSIGIGAAKVSVFGLAGVMHAREIAIALLTGTMAFPGAFLARALVKQMPVHLHGAILDTVVIIGGGMMLVGAIL